MSKEDPIKQMAMPDGRTMYRALQPGQPQQGIDNLLLSDDPTMRAHGRLLATGVADVITKWLAAEKKQAYAQARNVDDLSNRLNDMLNAVTNLTSGCMIQCIVGVADPSTLDALVESVAEEIGTHLRGKLLVWRQWKAERESRGGRDAE